jgi:hypothetical protein
MGDLGVRRRLHGVCRARAHTASDGAVLGGARVAWRPGAAGRAQASRAPPWDELVARLVRARGDTITSLNMAGLSFGTSRWDDIPAALGLRVESGILMGQWNGLAVQAAFDNEYDRERDTYYHSTSLRAYFDPPLWLGTREVRGLDEAHRKRVLEAGVLGELAASVVKATQLSDYWVGPLSVSGKWWRHEGAADRYRGAFDALTHAASVIVARRAADPAAWERAVHANWPEVAKAWNFAVDARRYRLWAKVHGRDVVVCPTIERDPNGGTTDVFTTKVQVQLGLPPGAALSLSRQNGDGFFRRLFRGQDVILGDVAFDAAFVVKGEPESFVRAALGPGARAQLTALRADGYEVTLHDGVLDVLAPSFTSDAAELDALLKRAVATATAFSAV